jgi:hypothetical protein
MEGQAEFMTDYRNRWKCCPRCHANYPSRCIIEDDHTSGCTNHGYFERAVPLLTEDEFWKEFNG